MLTTCGLTLNGVFRRPVARMESPGPVLPIFAIPWPRLLTELRHHANERSVMNARFLSHLSVFSFAAMALSCSSTPEPATSGAAKYTLQDADAALRNPLSLSACPDGGKHVFIGTVGGDGSQQLISDGTDGARVVCKVD